MAKEKFLKIIILGHFKQLKLLKNTIKLTGLSSNTPSEYYYQSKFNFSPHVKAIEKKISSHKIVSYQFK